MRIVAGTKKGKILNSPTDNKTRPTSDMARKALFDILNSMLLKKHQKWSNITFLDVFAGTGAVGVEALSRGAKQTYFIENYLPALACLKQNTKECENAHILSVDAACPPFTTNPVDIIFLDAPYREELWEKALPALLSKGWINDKTLIIIQIDKKEECLIPQPFELTDDRSYGRNRLLFLKKTIQTSGVKH